MRYCLLNIAYDSTFHGLQVQPSGVTVQGEIMRHLALLGIKKVYAASRTDSGVRAASNIIEVEYHDCLKIAKIVDSIKGIIVRGYLGTDSFIKLRGAFKKNYLYTDELAEFKIDPDTVVKEFMEGKQDAFIRDDPKRLNLLEVKFLLTGKHIFFSFVGTSFSWNYVRIAAQCLIDRITGKLDDEEWKSITDGKIKFTKKGKGENLLLLMMSSELHFVPYTSRKLTFLNSEIMKLYAWTSKLNDGLLSDIIMLDSFINGH